MKTMNKRTLENPLLLIILLICILSTLISSCASQSTSDTAGGEASEAAPSKPTAPASESQPVAESSGNTTAEQSKPADIAPSIQLAEIGESCKQQPYVEYEKQAREHIQRGWEATQAQRFGVGFRDTAEYEKWSETHKQLFSKVSDICVQLSDCVKKNPTDKAQKCATEAKRFEQWQAQAKRFVDKVKIVESSQPPMLCSITPSMEDPSQCYALLADQIDQTCQTPSCSDTAGCFRGVYYLDDAINQAKLACGFVGQKLSECRGYIEATGRRKTEVQQCLDMYNQLQVEILPVL